MLCFNGEYLEQLNWIHALFSTEVWRSEVFIVHTVIVDFMFIWCHLKIVAVLMWQTGCVLNAVFCQCVLDYIHNMWPVCYENMSTRVFSWFWQQFTQEGDYLFDVLSWVFEVVLEEMNSLYWLTMCLYFMCEWLCVVLSAWLNNFTRIS